MTAFTRPEIDYGATYLGLYRHGDLISEANAAACMTLPTARHWAMVPERDGLSLKVCRRDRLTTTELRAAEEWAARSIAALPTTRDEAALAYEAANDEWLKAIKAVDHVAANQLREKTQAAYQCYQTFVQADIDAAMKGRPI